MFEKPEANEFGDNGAVLSVKTLEMFVKSGFVPVLSEAKNPPPWPPATFRTNSFAVKLTGPTCVVNTPPPSNSTALLLMKFVITHVKPPSN